MSRKLEHELTPLLIPTREEQAALDSRQRETSRILDRLVKRFLGGSPSGSFILEEFIPFQTHVKETFAELPVEISEFLHAFRPMATSISYRLEVQKIQPKLGIIVARGMEDVGSVNVYTKKSDIHVAAHTNWTTNPALSASLDRLAKTLMPANQHTYKITNLRFGQQILLFALMRTTSAPEVQSPEGTDRL